MRRATSRAAAVPVCLALLGGCAAGPEAKGPEVPGVEKSAGPEAKGPEAPGVGKSAGPSAPAKAERPEVARGHEWESFTHTDQALHREIGERAQALRQGPIGNHAVELASLRLAAGARDLIDAGSPDGAVEALERAVSLWGRNGYAYLYLAYVHHVQGRSERAAESAASARRYLPRDEAVRGELEGLVVAIRHGGVGAGT